MVSVAGGWFFLMPVRCLCSAHATSDSRGLGSYLQTAASLGNMTAIMWGLLVMIAIIVCHRSDRVAAGSLHGATGSQVWSRPKAHLAYVRRYFICYKIGRH